MIWRSGGLMIRLVCGFEGCVLIGLDAWVGWSIGAGGEIQRNIYLCRHV